MKKKKLSSVTALIIPFTAIIMALWLVCMCLLTVATARSVPEDLEAQMEHILSMNDYLSGPHNRASILAEFTEEFEDNDVELAMMLYRDGEPDITTKNYAYMEYFNSDTWFNGHVQLVKPEYDGFNYDGWACIDLDFYLGENHPLLEEIRKNDGIQADFIRLSGAFYGREFFPYEIAILNKSSSLRYFGRSAASLGEKDLYSDLDWKILKSEDPNYIPEVLLQKEDLTVINCVSIYSTTNMIYGRAPEEYPYLIFDLELQDDLENQRFSNSDTIHLSEAVLFRRVERELEECTLSVEAAIRCYPLKAAMKQLWFVYFVTFTAAVGLVVLCGTLLKGQIEKPLQQIIDSADRNVAPLHTPFNARWKEPYRLQQSYIVAQQELQNLRQENKQLKTALDYAENAEINRRQMVSNITHELKTPLAVIHSYCEGLQAGIAPEKREKYLSVITEEADRMDAMVLEMLDLSRLEAGKVRLAQDNVELLGLTRSILDKLHPLLEAKELSVLFAIAEASPLTADEGRLGQVITNLATNAIKYSPVGGRVLINVFQRNGFTHFSIENESAPLSEEALEKVWESFYRTEQSRTSKGTGLGLSICKAIIELHRGTCQVKNTSTGVEFSFMLPG